MKKKINKNLLKNRKASLRALVSPLSFLLIFPSPSSEPPILSLQSTLIFQSKYVYFADKSPDLFLSPSSLSLRSFPFPFSFRAVHFLKASGKKKPKQLFSPTYPTLFVPNYTKTYNMSNIQIFKSIKKRHIKKTNYPNHTVNI